MLCKAMAHSPQVNAVCKNDNWSAHIQKGQLIRNLSALLLTKISVLPWLHPSALPFMPCLLSANCNFCLKSNPHLVKCTKCRQSLYCVSSIFLLTTLFGKFDQFLTVVKSLLPQFSINWMHIDYLSMQDWLKKYVCNDYKCFSQSDALIRCGCIFQVFTIFLSLSFCSINIQKIVEYRAEKCESIHI